MSRDALKRLGEIARELEAADLRGDFTAAHDLYIEENAIVAAMTVEDRYSYNLSLAAAFFDSSRDTIDDMVERACGTPDVAVKNARLDETLRAFNHGDA